MGQAFIRLPDDSVHRVHTPTLPRITVTPERLAAVRESYLHAHFRPMPRLDAPTTPVVTPAPTATGAQRPRIRRHHPDKPPGQTR